MNRRKPLMPGEWVRCHREDGAPCPGHRVTAAHFYLDPSHGIAATVNVSPARCGMSGPGQDPASAFVRAPQRFRNPPLPRGMRPDGSARRP